MFALKINIRDEPAQIVRICFTYIFYQQLPVRKLRAAGITIEKSKC
jgi:hypothetical protein